MTSRSDGRRHQHHAGDRKQHQRVVLALRQMLALDRRPGERQRQQADDDQHPGDEQAEVVGRHDAEAGGVVVPQQRPTRCAAPTRPMAPSGPIGIRSPGDRNASAIIAAMAAAVTHSIGTMAFRDVIIGDSAWDSASSDARAGRPDAECPRSPNPARLHADRRLRLDLAHHPRHRRLDRPQKQIRQHAHQDRGRDDRHEHDPLARRQIRHRRVLLVAHRSVVDALKHPEHVGGRQHDAGRGERRQARVPAERAEQNQELADEPVQSGQADRRQRDDQERGDQVRHDLLQAAVLRDQPRVPPVRQHADDEEEAAGADAVVEHLVDGALHALHVHRGDAEHDEPEMADARIGDELLHVRLHHRHERAVDDADDREHRQVGREERRGQRKQRKREAHQPVRAHLQQHAGENDRAGGRRLDVRVGQPRVKRKQRHLDRERRAQTPGRTRTAGCAGICSSYIRVRSKL